MTEEALNIHYDSLGKTLGEELLTPTRIYVETLQAIKRAGIKIKGCGHITGGGFYENIPRMLPEGIKAVIQKNSYEIPPIFKMLANDGDIKEEVMYNTFNMGIGMVLAVKEEDAGKTLEAIRQTGIEGYVIGKTEGGDKGVTIC